MAIRIDHDVPLPTTSGAGRKEKYPVSKMGVGDSFFVRSGNVESTAAAVYRAAARQGFRVMYRAVRNGVRFWRKA